MAIKTEVVFYQVFNGNSQRVNVLVYDSVNNTMIAWRDNSVSQEELDEIKRNYEEWALTATEQDIVTLVGAGK